jgi:transmembrane sensor
MNHQPEHMDEALLLRFLLGEAGAEEQSLVREWLDKSQENRALLDKLESLWLETGRISPSPVAVDTDAAWEKMSRRMDSITAISPVKEGKTRKIGLRIAIAAAASLLILVGIYGIYKWIASPVPQVEVLAFTRVVSDTLPDGSLITLNTGSRLSYPAQFKGKTREVAISGEAYCKIRHDPANPFVISCGRARIKVLGTSFLVTAYPGKEITVTVDEGLVQFFTVNDSTGDTAAIRLSAGMKGQLAAGSSHPVVADTVSLDELFWLNRTIYFRDTPLNEVFTVISRNYHITITASDSTLYHCRLTTSFKDETAADIMSVIAETFGLQLSKENDTYRLSGHGCKKNDR